MSPAVRRILLSGEGSSRPLVTAGLGTRFDCMAKAGLNLTTDLFSGTGTATTTLISTALVGVGTSFVNELAAGDRVYTNADVLIGTISSVTNTTNAVLTANAAAAITGAAFKIVRAAPRIAQFNDLGIFGRHATSLNAAGQPTYFPNGGLPYALLNGLNQYARGPLFTLNPTNPGVSIYIVAEHVTWTDLRALVDLSDNTGTGQFQLRQSGVTPSIAIAPPGGTQAASSDLAVGARGVISCISGGSPTTDLRLRVNTGAVNAGVSAGVSIGAVCLGARWATTLADRFVNAKIYEILVYVMGHSTSTEDRIKRDLMKKWRVAA